MISQLPIFIIVFAACVFVGMFMQAMVYRAAGKAFKIMEDRHPEYYKSLGEPLINGFFRLKRINSGNEYAMKLSFKGIPSDTPDDPELRGWLEEAKKYYTITYWIMLIAVIAWVGGFLTRS